LPEAINFVIASATILTAAKEEVAATTGKVRRRWDTGHVLARGLSRCNRLLRSVVAAKV
jgi:hypothetical protein